MKTCIRTAASLFCAAALALGLAACGGVPTPDGPAGSSDPAGGQTAARSTAPGAPSGTVRLTTASEHTTTTHVHITCACTTGTPTSHRPPSVAAGGCLEGLTPVQSLPDGFAQGYNTFALRLIRETRQAGKAGENSLIAPASVYLALAMTANGAAGDTRAQMLEVLGVQGLDALNTGSRDLQSVLTGNDRQSFRLANGVWLNSGRVGEPLDKFRETVGNYYGGRIERTPFSGALIQDINDWVADNTAGRIDELLDSDAADSAAILVNALLFEGKWQEPFTKSATRDGVFHAPGGDVTLPLMQQTVALRTWYEGDDVQAVRLPFDDGRTSLLLVLPKKEGAVALDEWIAGLDADGLARLLETKPRKREVRLTLPRFALSFKDNLNDSLKAMGMTDAFDETSADFSALAPSYVGRLYISDVVHETRLEVAENGVLAAAATAVVLRDGGILSPDETLELRFDRPFFCGLVDEDTATLLFGGAVCRPEALN